MEANLGGWFTTPHSSPLWGYGVILFVALSNFALGFLVMLTRNLRLRVFPLLAAIFTVSLLLNVFIPHPTVRKFQEGIAFPPVDAIRLGSMSLCWAIGLWAVYRYLIQQGILSKRSRQ